MGYSKKSSKLRVSKNKKNRNRNNLNKNHSKKRNIRNKKRSTIRNTKSKKKTMKGGMLKSWRMGRRRGQPKSGKGKKGFFEIGRSPLRKSKTVELVSPPSPKLSSSPQLSLSPSSPLSPQLKERTLEDLERDPLYLDLIEHVKLQKKRINNQHHIAYLKQKINAMPTIEGQSFRHQSELLLNNVHSNPTLLRLKFNYTYPPNLEYGDIRPSMSPEISNNMVQKFKAASNKGKEEAIREITSLSTSSKQDFQKLINLRKKMQANLNKHSLKSISTKIPDIHSAIQAYLKNKYGPSLEHHIPTLESASTALPGRVYTPNHGQSNA
jgi:hypothetical protein